MTVAPCISVKRRERRERPERRERGVGIDVRWSRMPFPAAMLIAAGGSVVLGSLSCRKKPCRKLAGVANWPFIG